jgi:hypothetical protein
MGTRARPANMSRAASHMDRFLPRLTTSPPSPDRLSSSMSGIALRMCETMPTRTARTIIDQLGQRALEAAWVMKTGNNANEIA